MGHTHNKDGNHEGPYETTDGKKIYTYYKVYCTCGEYVENDITNTRDK